jgi:hypothetical protein
MPTTRRRRAHTFAGDRITPEALEAWRTGDWKGLFRALNIPIEDTNPFDISEDGVLLEEPLIAMPDGYDRQEARAVRLRRELLKICPPGRVGRHGEPWGQPRTRAADGFDQGHWRPRDQGRHADCAASTGACPPVDTCIEEGHQDEATPSSVAACARSTSGPCPRDRRDPAQLPWLVRRSRASVRARVSRISQASSAVSAGVASPVNTPTV